MPADQKFQAGHSVLVSWHGEANTSLVSYGQWKDAKNKYIGLKFIINGKVHYGWARLNVKLVIKTETAVINATLTGYAYETIPNKPIIAGKTHGADDAEPPTPAALTTRTPKPATLGVLAMGWPGLSIWRRESH